MLYMVIAVFIATNNIGLEPYVLKTSISLAEDVFEQRP